MPKKEVVGANRITKICIHRAIPTAMVSRTNQCMVEKMQFMENQLYNDLSGDP